MAGRWRIEGAGGVWLVRGDARAAALVLKGEALGRDAAAARVDLWFPAGWGQEAADKLASIWMALEGVFPGDGAPNAEWLKRTLQRALRDGRITAVRVKLGSPAWGVEEEEQERKAALRLAAREEKTWIEIVLTDDAEPPRPVAYAKYRIELPDGSLKEGFLNEHGRVRIAGIEPGMCRVTFPGLDGREWS